MFTLHDLKKSPEIKIKYTKNKTRTNRQRKIQKNPQFFNSISDFKKKKTFNEVFSPTFVPNISSNITLYRFLLTPEYFLDID